MLEMYFSFVRVELYVTVLIATDFYLGAGGAEYGRRMSHLVGYVHGYAFCLRGSKKEEVVVEEELRVNLLHICRLMPEK